MKEISSEVLNAAIAGDAEAFNYIAERISLPVYHFCLAFLKNPAFAEDAAQEILLKAFKSISSFKKSSSLSTWIYSISYNHCIDVCRKNSRAEYSLDELVAGGMEPISARTGDSLNQLSDRLIVETALSRLSPEHRAIITLRELSGLSYEEIAQTLAIEEGTVKSRLARAKENLCATIRSIAPAEPEVKESVSV